MLSLRDAANPAVSLFPWTYSPRTSASSYLGDLFAGEQSQAVLASTLRRELTAIYTVHQIDMSHYGHLGLREWTQGFARATGQGLSLPGLPAGWQLDYLRLMGAGLIDAQPPRIGPPLSLSLAEYVLRDVMLPGIRIDAGETLSSAPGAGRGPASSHQATPEGLDPVAIAAAVTQGLQITDRQLKSITGVGKTTLHNWRHKKSKPRASTLDRLLRVFALLRMVVDEVGTSEAAIWFRSGSPSPLSLLLKGDVAGVENAIADRLFADLRPQRETHRAFAPDIDFEVEAPPLAAPLRRFGRAPRRVKLPSDDRPGQ